MEVENGPKGQEPKDCVVQTKGGAWSKSSPVLPVGLMIDLLIFLFLAIEDNFFILSSCWSKS